MASKKPVIAVRVSQPVYQTFSRLAELSGRSRSSIVNEYLESIHPAIMRTVALLEAARDAPNEIKQGLIKTCEDLERDLSGSLGDAMGALDSLMDWSGEPESTPVLVTRGSGASRTLPKIVISAEITGGWSFRLLNAAGEVISVGSGFDTKHDAQKCAQDEAEGFRHG